MNGGRRILVVEDDEAIAAGLVLNLRVEGYAPEVVHDGEAATEVLCADPPDLVVLDLSLPKKNGLEVLAEMRAAGGRTPVIVLSARQEELDKVGALRLGADDYVTKPFALAELIARIAAVLRRSERAFPSDSGRGAAGGMNAGRRVHRFDDVEVDLDTRRVVRAGVEVKVTHLELELLAYLLAHPGQVLARDQLLRVVWGVKHSGSARTVDNFVAQLRAKLEKDPEAPRHLVTVRGSGYRFDP